MKIKRIVMIFLYLLTTPWTYGQNIPEQQVSFARESKPHSYYVEQAELWAKELQLDSLSENNWYNYFRACRNAHGTSDWRSDFVNESPYLMEGGDVVSLMKQYIPQTFTYYYLSYLTQGIGTGNYENLMKAYEINPNFEGIHSSVISYAESSLDSTLRKKINKEWYKTNYISHQLLNYNYNVLMSLDSNAILFTQHDNDTYPAWMLQDAMNIRSDVTVINIDFLLLDNYREFILNKLKVKALDLGEINIDEYRLNWEKVVAHILNNYNGNKPIYLGMTLFNHLYNDFEKQLYVSGLAFRYSTTELDLVEKNKRLYQEIFFLDYLFYTFSTDPNQVNVNYQNTNYMSCFKTVYDIYKSENNLKEANKIKGLAILLADRISNPTFLARINDEFD
ncbi:MAG: hypothetical protein CVV22_06715 [Ignavibacteriae bacterium HGW-Ignavibacteriae-1]|nr:MAG: hypothetical protein CVV22_06715 [Ignavibacteriae bacterium HGW-Ignavibacteriae-1]